MVMDTNMSKKWRRRYPEVVCLECCIKRHNTAIPMNGHHLELPFSLNAQSLRTVLFREQIHIDQPMLLIYKNKFTILLSSHVHTKGIVLVLREQFHYLFLYNIVDVIKHNESAMSGFITLLSSLQDMLLMEVHVLPSIEALSHHILYLCNCICS
jgi:hypothetical protein